MKIVTCLIFILFIGATAQAQNATALNTAKTIEVTIVNSTTTIKNNLKNTIEVARLHRHKNHLIKSALSFATKINNLQKMS